VAPRFRIAAAAGIIAAVLGGAVSQGPASSGRLHAQSAGVDLKTLIGNLASLDYTTRTHAARLVRRAPAAEAVPALTEAVRRHPDEFVRARAFVLLSAFNERATAELVPSLLPDRNDRLRETAYKWLEQHPDARLTGTLLAALQTESAEFVRPALLGALAALDADVQVQRALTAEATRGLDLFREAVIEAIGRRGGTYAVDTIAGVAKLDGPLRDTALLSLGRIGGATARAVLKEVGASPGESGHTIRAALCAAGEGCDEALKALTQAASTTTGSANMRAAVSALAAIASSGRAASGNAVPGFNPAAPAAIEAIVTLAGRGGAVRDQAALAISTVALRRPAAMVAWLAAASEMTRSTAIDLLKDGFERLEEDFAEEQFYAAARATYWQAADGSGERTLMASLIEKLQF
jgi:HEAT repeat protein